MPSFSSFYCAKGVPNKKYLEFNKLWDSENGKSKGIEFRVSIQDG
jgi:hypothetical protein